MKLDFCPSCARIVLRGFGYCPYCGAALRAGPGFEEALREPFERLAGMQADFRGRKIEELLLELETLEAEIDEIVRALSPDDGERSPAPLPR